MNLGPAWWNKNDVHWTTQSRDTIKRTEQSLSDLTELSVDCLPPSSARCSTGSVQPRAHEEWMGADRQELTHPLWRLTSAVMVAPQLMLWGPPLESPTWIGLDVIFTKAWLAANWLICTRGTDPVGCTGLLCTCMLAQLAHKVVYMTRPHLYHMHLL